jgi:hypothetical protein
MLSRDIPFELHDVEAIIISQRQQWLRAAAEFAHSTHERNNFDSQGKTPSGGKKN